MRRESLGIGLLGVLLTTASGCTGMRDAIVRKSDVSTPAATVVRAANHPNSDSREPDRPNPKATIDGLTYRAELVEDPWSSDNGGEVQTASSESYFAATPGLATLEIEAARQFDVRPVTLAEPLPREPLPTQSLPANSLQLNLPTALSMVGGQHPAVGFAQWRVQQAYAQLDRARVLWLPSIQAGFSFDRHDGNLQASDGSIVDVNRNSFQYGLGAGAVGAGTTLLPGIVARFHAADAIFQPKIAQKTAWARGHAANGVVNQQLLAVALAYLELLDAEQDRSIVKQSRQRTTELSKLTGDFAAAGRGLQADADRLETELLLVDNRLATADERVEVASARLSEALSLSGGERIVPLDPTVVPIELVSAEYDRGTLISTGLNNRPELKESQALVAAACDQYQRQKYAPLIPSVLLGFSTGGFGGGLGNNLNNVDGRYDFDAIVTWEIRNLGLGEKAARCETAAVVQQAKFEKVRVLDQVAREINEAHAQVTNRYRRISITQNAIASAEDSYQRNVSRIRDGQGLPLEVLQSLQALEDAHARIYRRSSTTTKLNFACSGHSVGTSSHPLPTLPSPG